MKKVWDIAFKDMLHAFRSAFALAFMFVVPILTVAMFFLAFGGLSGDGDGGFSLATVKVQVVNLDQGTATGPAMGSMMELPDDFASEDIETMGDFFVAFLRHESLQEVLDVSEAPDVASAHAAVDAQDAAVALTIPEGFTSAIYDLDGTAEIGFYQDPTLSIGPSIVKSIIAQFIDGFSGTKIALSVVTDQLEAAGGTFGPAQYPQFVQAYTEMTSGNEQVTASQGEMDQQFGIETVPPPGKDKEPSDSMLGEILALNLTGMMIFYAVFTGTSSAQRIIQEEEEGTLPRLFTTPTPVETVLQGKYLAIGLIVLVQITVLVLFGDLVFGIEWGNLLQIVLAAAGSIAVASTFGIFVMSWLKDTRQVGILYGGVVTVTGMLGMISIFTAGAPGANAATEIIGLVVPQGWAIRGWDLTREGAPLAASLANTGICLLWSVVFFVIGSARFKKRYA